ncbi:hypothetical protein SEVIR_4G015600v4 [Setaria viridis]|uniref:Uncharacterized protein n=1 Tax=Setaria viridis TaxID=4556 RepID=A0A4U6UX90_SETVI|nr:uncharacterized protein LOC117851431 [Setaria viridis]TKW19363.1 hypothetical protein SEVIR_4G015600v2 [Setaria viridis]
MADVLVGSERRVLISGYGLPAQAPPPPESLLGRLDQIDLRLRQLEEQRRPAPAADDDGRRAQPHQVHHHHTKSLPSALQHQHVQVRGTLMDRLNLLESRIRQLSCELDLDIGGKAGGYAAAAAQLGMMGGSSSVAAPPAVEDPAWSDTAPMLEPCRDPAAAVMSSAPATKSAAAAADGSWSAVEILQRGARQLHRSKSSATNKVKNLKEAKCACQKEKRKAERVRTGRRWFPVGC